MLQDLFGRFGLAAVVVVHQVEPARPAGRPRPLHRRGLRGRRRDRRQLQGQLGLLAVEAAGAGHAGRRRGRLAVGGGGVGEALDLEGARGVDQGGEVLLERGTCT